MNSWKIIVGNLVALASIDSSQIESMKQPFVDSLFNILDACRQRQIHDEQNGKQSKTTSIWHPILGHIRGKNHTITVFVHSIILLSQKIFVSSSDQIKRLFNVLFCNINISGRNHLLICYSNRSHREMFRQQRRKKKRVNEEWKFRWR